MTMGDPNLLQLQATLVHLVQDQVQITPWVNHRRLARLIVPDERAVLLKRGHGYGVVLQHGPIIGDACPLPLAGVYSRSQPAPLKFGLCAASIAPLHSSFPSYLTKQESIAIKGVDDLLIRSLLDNNQFHDPLDEALNVGISAATWPLFGLLWPSGQRMAERIARRPVTHERILEIGCGLGLSSLVAHRRTANVTASDCHPLTHAFLQENARLNGLPPVTYRHGLWGTAASREDGLPVLTAVQDDLVHGLFDLIMGSDILYERDEKGTLSRFINHHAAPACEVWVVDPNRGNRPAFHKHMACAGFALHEHLLDQPAFGSTPAYKGRMLTYTRG
jgi:predicted nicotinamide N-methyase